MVNRMKNEYRPVFSTTTPCSARYFDTSAAGMPLSPKLPDMSRPGVMMVALIGSSMLKPGARSPKPCQWSPDSSTQSSRWPMPSGARRLGPHTLNHQSSLPNSEATLRMARRKSMASRMLSSTRAVPPGGSIMAAATSHDAMIAYCGEVDVCIR
ncbi:Uncharacterised protein [Bordetella pertussis]|nr:Uncharacterised protein [Bordetella pertussis]CPJ03105.1 Uncharacterised protein [Bordetella pertussis]